MRRSIVRLIFAFVFFLASFCILTLHGSKAASVRALVNKDTFEFKNEEKDDAFDLHIEWDRAVNIKYVSQFKKTSGNGTGTTDVTKGKVEIGDVASVTVTWDGSDPSIKKWWWTKKDGSRLGDEKSGKPATVQIQSGAGLYVTTFARQQGKIKVYLPDDMMAGDTISGTVVSEPNGASDDERSRNRATLEGYVIEIGDTKTTPKQPKFSLLIPETKTSRKPVIRIVDKLGHVIQSSPLPVQPLAPTSAQPGFTFPPLAQAGRPVEITGSFDGNAANTTIRFGPDGSTAQDFDKNTVNGSGGFGLLDPIVESPREAVVETPVSVTGLIEIMIRDKDVQSIVPCRNVGVNLTAPKTNLLRGEQTTLTVDVTGLEGITNNVPLDLHARGVIQMEGGNFQQITIYPSDVETGGRYKTARAITGEQAGAFTCTARIVYGVGLSQEVKSKDELLDELDDLRERKRYDCKHGRKYQQAMADRIATIKRVLRSFHGMKILNDPIDANCPPK